MQELIQELQNESNYIKTVISELKVQIEICNKIGFSLQARKLTDEKDIHIEHKDYLEVLIKKYTI